MNDGERDMIGLGHLTVQPKSASSPDTVEVRVDDLRSVLDLIDWRPKSERPEALDRLEDAVGDA